MNNKFVCAIIVILISLPAILTTATKCVKDMNGCVECKDSDSCLKCNQFLAYILLNGSCIRKCDQETCLKCDYFNDACERCNSGYNLVTDTTNKESIYYIYF